MEVPYIRQFTIHDLVEHRAYLEKAVHASLPYLAEENEVLRQFWSLIAESALANEREAKLAAGGRVAITEDGPEQDDAWYLLVEDWAMLPVCNCDGEGDEGENLIPINQAHDVVAVTILDNDAQRAQSLTGILQICGVTTLQADLVADERIMRILRAKMVSTHQGL